MTNINYVAERLIEAADIELLKVVKSNRGVVIYGKANKNSSDGILSKIKEGFSNIDLDYSFIPAYKNSSDDSEVCTVEIGISIRGNINCDTFSKTLKEIVQKQFTDEEGSELTNNEDDPALERIYEEDSFSCLLYEGVPFTGKTFDEAPDGSEYCIRRFKNGVLHGNAEVWFQDGTIKEIVEFKNGLKHGQYLCNYRDGSIKIKAVFINNIRVDEEIYAQDGQSLDGVEYINFPDAMLNYNCNRAVDSSNN